MAARLRSNFLMYHFQRLEGAACRYPNAHRAAGASTALVGGGVRRLDLLVADAQQLEEVRSKSVFLLIKPR